MSSSRVFRSRSVPRATPMRVNSPISRLRFAASDRARAVSMRAAASRYPARTATSSWRGPTGGFTKPESSSEGISAGRSGSPSRPRATIAPPPPPTPAGPPPWKTGRPPVVPPPGFLLLPRILEQGRLGVELRPLGGARPVQPPIRGLPGERGQVGVLHQPSGDGADDVEQVVALHAVRLDLDDLAGLHVDEPRVEPEVTVEIDERAGDDVARADELPDLRRGFRGHLARRAEALLREQLLDLLALHHARRRIGGQLRDQHPGDPLLQRVEVLLVLPVRAAVVEGQDGDARSGILAAALPAQLARHRAEQRERQQCGDETPTHRVRSSDQRVSVIPSCAATTSAGRPFVRAWPRAAATRASIASSPCSGSW